jgi:hypothetical protein
VDYIGVDGCGVTAGQLTEKLAIRMRDLCQGIASATPKVSESVSYQGIALAIPKVVQNQTPL